jgi:hypothetical protein
MIGAVLTSLPLGFPMFLLPLITGLVAAFVAYGRWRLAPLRDRSQTSVARTVS